MCHPLVLKKIFPKLKGEVALRNRFNKMTVQQIVRRGLGTLGISGGTQILSLRITATRVCALENQAIHLTSPSPLQVTCSQDVYNVGLQVTGNFVLLF